jgi:hypothetical protein
MAQSKSTIIRDFGGGLNVVDDDLNLSSSYQPVLDNVHRGVDNTLNVRWGTELFADLRLGTVTSNVDPFVATWTIDNREVVCQYASHGLLNGDHITFTANWTNMAGLKPEEIINIPLSVRVTDGNNFTFVVKTKASASGTDTATKSVTKDTHFLTGDIIEITYFSDHVVVFDTLGEIVKINAAGFITRIWDNSIAFSTPGTAQPGPGWTNPIDYVSTAVFKGSLIACNGVDKPLIIDFSKTPNVTYLADPGDSYSTAHVPVCKYVCTIDRWLIMAGDPLYPYKVHISSSDAGGVWEGATDSDGTSIDLNNTNSSSLFIRGINKFRNFLAVAFDDTVSMIELGIFDSTEHKPEVTDSVARHGAVAHKSMIFLGFDLVMADTIGVPSFKKSQFDNSIIPSRLSEFIAPMLQKNISRLTASTLVKDVFSVYSTHDSRYILFAPNHDNVPIQLPNDPIYYVYELMGTKTALLHAPNHSMEEGDQFQLSQLDVVTTDIPIKCVVSSVVSEDIITFTTVNVIGQAKRWGGPTVAFNRLRTEMTAYALTYNRDLKIKAWSRYKGWNFVAGTTSLYGRVFLASKDKVWRMGNRFDPIYGDFKGEYDGTWVNGVSYTVGQRIKDTVTKEIFECVIAHTSGSDGTFDENRDFFPYNWKPYKGRPINFAVEFPWADFDKRDMTKIMKTMNIDAKGTDRFTVQMFLDYYYKHKITGVRTPAMSMDMVGGDKGAYGAYEQTYGTGRMAVRQRPWPFQARGKLFKLRLQGATVEPLRFTAFIFSYKITGRDR